MTVGLVALVGTTLGLRWYHQHGRGVEIRLHNVQSRPLRSPEVFVTGASYSVGDLAPGAIGSVWAEPTSDSHVEISFALSTGEVKRVPVPNSYLEPRNSGWISVDVTADDARAVENHVELAY